MLRSVTLGLMLAVLAAACALVEEPVPPGTIPLQLQVRNERGPVELALRTPSGVLAGAVRPATLPAKTTTNVTFYAPPGNWWIDVNGSTDFAGVDLSGTIREGCTPSIASATCTRWPPSASATARAPASTSERDHLARRFNVERFGALRWSS